MDTELEIERLWAALNDVLERLREREGSCGAQDIDVIGFWVDQEEEFDEDDSEY